MKTQATQHSLVIVLLLVLIGLQFYALMSLTSKIEVLEAKIESNLVAVKGDIATLESVSSQLQGEIQRTNDSLTKSKEVTDFVETRMREVAEAMKSGSNSPNSFQNVGGAIE